MSHSLIRVNLTKWPRGHAVAALACCHVTPDKGDTCVTGVGGDGPSDMA